MRRKRAFKRLVNYTRRTARSQTGTSSGTTGCATGRTVDLNAKLGGQYKREKHCMWKVIFTLFNLILRMQDVVLILIFTCLWGTMKSTPVMTDKDQQPRKYTAQLFDCKVPGKIHLLQIPDPVMEHQRRGRWLHCKKPTF